MFLDQLEVEEDVRWALKPKKTKRRCEYLNTNSKELFLLAAPAIKETLTLQNSLQVQKKICLPKAKIGFKKMFTFILNPANIIGYLHCFLNFFIISVFTLCVCYIVTCAGRDISYKISLKRSEAKILMKEAKELYFLNRCDPTTRVPALQLQCDKWDHMSKHGMYSIKYTKIVVEMFADVIDGFVSKFKFKSVVVLITFFTVYFLLRRKST